MSFCCFNSSILINSQLKNSNPSYKHIRKLDTAFIAGGILAVAILATSLIFIFTRGINDPLSIVFMSVGGTMFSLLPLSFVPYACYFRKHLLNQPILTDKLATNSSDTIVEFQQAPSSASVVKGLSLEQRLADAGMVGIGEKALTALNSLIDSRDKAASERGILIQRMLLIYGPSGTGKTSLARAISSILKYKQNIPHDTRKKYISEISCPTLMEMDFDDFKEKIDLFFVPSLESLGSELSKSGNFFFTIIFDQFDKVFTRDYKEGEKKRDYIFNLLFKTNHLFKDFLFIAVMDQIDNLGPEFLKPGYLDQNTHVPLSLPNAEERRKIFDYFLKPLRNKNLIEDLDESELIKLSEGLTGAHIQCIINDANKIAFERKSLITLADLKEACLRLFPTKNTKNAVIKPLKNLSLEEALIEKGIGGLDNVSFEKLKPLVEGRGEYKDLYLKRGLLPEKGVLIYGPPGTGKTSLAAAVAQILGCDDKDEKQVRKVNSASLISRYYGETEKNIQKLFSPPQDNSFFVIIFDEIDAIFSHRNQKYSSVPASVQALFLQYLDGPFTPKSDYLFIGITNYKEGIDASYLRPGRLGTHLYLGLPAPPARKKIFSIYLDALKKNSLIENIDDSNLEKLAKESDELTGAQIKEVVSKANIMGLEREKTKNNSLVTMDDLSEAIKQVRESSLNRLKVTN